MLYNKYKIKHLMTSAFAACSLNVEL